MYNNFHKKNVIYDIRFISHNIMLILYTYIIVMLPIVKNIILYVNVTHLEFTKTFPINQV